MGGHQDGEVAAETTAETVVNQALNLGFLHGASSYSKMSQEDKREWLQKVVHQANMAVLAERQKRGSNMGSTLVMAVRSGEEVAIANVGDSRAYLIAGDKKTMRQVTRDHTMAARLVELGQISPEEAKVHSQRNQIYRVMGQESLEQESLEVDVFFDEIPRGGSLLLCSDGLSGMVDDGEIGRIIVSSASAQEATRKLIEAANAAGGEDNISAIVVRNVSEAAPTPAAPEAASPKFKTAINRLMAVRKQADSEARRAEAGRALADFYNALVDLSDSELKQVIAAYYGKEVGAVSDDDIGRFLAAFAVETRKMKAKFSV